MYLFRTKAIVFERKSLGYVDSTYDKQRTTEESNDPSKIGLEKQLLDALQQQICNVHDHTVNINCVRFAPSSKPNLIATCSADGLVSIFQRRGFQPFGNNETSNENDKNNEEAWNQTYHTFRDHVGDVLCIEWSPDAKYIASCGVDNKIIIYDVEEKRMVKLLQDSEGIAKSLAWDPIGTYLAVQLGDEKESVIIYNARTWTLEKRIDESVDCFNLPSGSGVFTHASWSPNGQFLLVTGGRSGNAHVAPMFSRNDFDLVYMFKGHKEATTVAAFNPVLFIDEDNSQDYITYFAIGSSDARISIWSNKQKSPIALISYFGARVTDLAWSSDGLTLLASSVDGTVNSIYFTEDELGTPFDKNQLKALLKKEYGDNLDYSHLLQEYEVSTSAIAPIQPKKIEHSETPIVINTLQVRRRDEATVLNQIQTEEPSFKRTRESDLILQERFSKRIKPNIEETVTFNIRLQKLGAELRCSKNIFGGEVEMINSSNRNPIWKIHINGTPSLAVSNGKFTAIATAERMMYIISKIGRKISPGMILDSPAAFLACSNQNYLVVLCDNCNMYAWNVSTQQCILDINVYDLLTILKDRPQDITNNYELISSLYITDEGTIVVTTYTGEAFAYDTFSWKQWVSIMDSNLFSAYKSLSSKVLLSNPHDGDSNLKRISENEALNMSKKGLGFRRETHEEEDIETLMAISDSLKDSQAYRSYAKLYVKQTSSKKLSEFFQQLLLIDALKTQSPDQLFQELKIAGKLDRRVVLGELLNELKINSIQPELVKEYEKLLLKLWKIDINSKDVEDFIQESTNNTR